MTMRGKEIAMRQKLSGQANIKSEANFFFEITFMVLICFDSCIIILGIAYTVYYISLTGKGNLNFFCGMVNLY